ncbi:MAG: Uma2 family endonuclease [Actinomycetota bacterium]|nr:Uma2 family endonuclease [Actinomycetota bacterium]
MTTVMASTDAVPELAAALARRRRLGLDTYDEWWEGVYRVVTGPTPEHGRIAGRIFAFLDRLAEGPNLHVSAPLNVGADKDDARVPDVGVFVAGTPRTSPAFLSTAALVVEVLSADERPGAQLDFYARWGVDEYLEVDSGVRAVRLLRHTADGWQPTAASAVLPFRVADDELVADAERYRVDWPAAGD